MRSVSIVIPTFNGLALLRECLDALRRLSYPRDRLEITVVDNGSTDGTAQALQRSYPSVKVVRLETNTGFATACNRGASEAAGAYVAFLNNDAVADSGWIESLFAGLDAGGAGAVCSASMIRSKDGQEVEFSGASSNLFGAGRPVSVWGWPDMPEPPKAGSSLLFASGGAMLVHRSSFLKVGGFDPEFFAYFEDVDLGWRLWVLGYKVVYAPDAVVRHAGGATGSRSGIHRRYTLWECNSLATILKNYEEGSMERVLSAALLLQYKRALMSAGDAVKSEEYALAGPRDDNAANVERLPKVSVAHLAAIDRLLARLPHFMEERRRIQAARLRSDTEILPLLGGAWEPQFAGTEYADAARTLASALDLYGITREVAPNRVLVLVAPAEEGRGEALAVRLKDDALVAFAVINGEQAGSVEREDGYTRHRLQAEDPALRTMVSQADAVIIFEGAAQLQLLAETDTPVAVIGTGGAVRLPRALYVSDMGDALLVGLCRTPGVGVA